MSRLVSISLLATATMLIAACQQMPGGRSGQAGWQTATAPTPPQLKATPAQASPAPQATAAPVVEFRLAQPQKDAGLQPVTLGKQQLWVLPQPVLTRADLQSVVAVKSREGRSFVRFQLNQAGAPKLAQLSRRFPGKFLLLTINSQLASAPTIGGPMTEGVIFVPVLNESQAAQVAAAVAGTQPHAASGTPGAAALR